MGIVFSFACALLIIKQSSSLSKAKYPSLSILFLPFYSINHNHHYWQRYKPHKNNKKRSVFSPFITMPIMRRITVSGRQTIGKGRPNGGRKREPIAVRLLVGTLLTGHCLPFSSTMSFCVSSSADAAAVYRLPLVCGFVTAVCSVVIIGHIINISLAVKNDID